MREVATKFPGHDAGDGEALGLCDGGGGGVELGPDLEEVVLGAPGCDCVSGHFCLVACSLRLGYELIFQYLMLVDVFDTQVLFY